MNFKDWMDNVEDDEVYDLELFDAWKAGASAMLERLIELGYVDQGYESLAREEVKEIIGDK